MYRVVCGGGGRGRAYHITSLTKWTLSHFLTFHIAGVISSPNLAWKSPEFRILCRFDPNVNFHLNLGLRLHYCAQCAVCRYLGGHCVTMHGGTGGGGCCKRCNWIGYILQFEINFCVTLTVLQGVRGNISNSSSHPK